MENGEWNPADVSIDANEIESTVEAGWITESPINHKSVEELADYLQITIHRWRNDSFSRMYNLRHPNMPAVKEMGDMERLMDPDQFVETGFKLIAFSKKGGENGKNYDRRSLNSSPLQNLVIETRDDRDVFVYRRFTDDDVRDSKKFQDRTTHRIMPYTLWSRFFDHFLNTLMSWNPSWVKAVEQSLVNRDFTVDAETEAG